MTVSDETIEAVLAGCEGVTPGPWYTDDPWVIAAGDVKVEVTYLAATNDLDTNYHQQVRDAAHIARCDPDTIRAAFTELRELRRRSPPGGVSEAEVEAALDARPFQDVTTVRGFLPSEANYEGAAFQIMRSALAAARPYLHPAQAGETGWQLVPKEPTHEMGIAGFRLPASVREKPRFDECVAIYRAMLAAAPAAPQKETT